MKRLVAVLCLSWAFAVSAADVWVYNETTNQHVEVSSSNQPRPIASLTKLMTAIVTLDYDQNLQRKIRMPAGRLPAGMYTRQDVITAMLVRSDNLAADMIAADYPGGRRAFIKAMNTKARGIGMTHTSFSDPSGLSINNRSIAADVLIMMQNAARCDIIRNTSVKKQAIFETHYRKKIRTIELPNTNQPLLFKFDEIVVSKTGYTSASGWSVGLVVESQGQRFIVVILGARTKQQRFDIANDLVYNQLKDLDTAVMTAPEPVLPERGILNMFGF